MSVTVTVTPDANHAVFNPVEWAATSDRDGTDVQGAVTPTADAATSTYVEYIIAGHTYVVDDVLEATEYTADGLNTDMVVTSVVAGTSFVTNLLWSATYAGLSGKLELNNRNIFVRIWVYVSGAIVATKDVKPLSGVYTANISKILQGLVTYDKVDTAGAIGQSPAVAGSKIIYSLFFNDFWTDIFGNSYSDAAVAVPTIGGDAIIGFNMALNGGQLFADYVCSVATPGEFLTVKKDPEKHVDEVCQLAFLTEAASVQVRYTLNNYNGSTTGPTDTATLTINNNRGIVLIDGTLFPVTAETIEILIVDTTPAGAAMSETITISQRLKCLNGARVEWKNLLGGFDAYTFPEYENKQAVKAQSYQNTEWNTAQVKNTQTKKVIGKFSDPDTLDWLSEILTSRKITIDTDNAIILNNNLIPDSRNWKKPILTLRTDDKITN